MIEHIINFSIRYRWLVLLAALAHLSLLAGSATREVAPGLHRGQKVCTTAGSFRCD